MCPPPAAGSKKLHPCNPAVHPLHCGDAGAGLSGGTAWVSPAGLASCRSSAVKASMMARASKARFRRPTFTWRTMPADSRRFIASLVAWKLRPMSFAALVTETTGAPGSMAIRWSAADPARTRPRAARHCSWMRSTFASNAAASSTARRQAAENNPIHLLMPSWPASESAPAVASCGEAFNVGRRPRGEHE